jgi:hypothetical protein
MGRSGVIFRTISAKRNSVFRRYRRWLDLGVFDAVHYVTCIEFRLLVYGRH